jgi:hypothetical protein
MPLLLFVSPAQALPPSKSEQRAGNCMLSSFRSAQELLKEADITTKTPWPNRTSAVSVVRLPPSPSTAGELLIRNPSPSSRGSPPHRRPCSEPQTEMAAVRRRPLLFVSVAGGTRCISRSSSQQASTRDRRCRGAVVSPVPFRLRFLAATLASERTEPTPPFRSTR